MYVNMLLLGTQGAYATVSNLEVKTKLSDVLVAPFKQFMSIVFYSRAILSIPTY